MGLEVGLHVCDWLSFCSWLCWRFASIGGTRFGFLLGFLQDHACEERVAKDNVTLGAIACQ